MIVRCPACGKRNRVPAAANGHPRCASCRQDLPWIVEADAADFGTIVEGATVPVLVDLWAPWCGPCRTLSPALEELARRRAGHLKLVKINVDEHPDVSARFGIQGIPTLLLFRSGRLLDRAVGARGIAALERWVDAVVARSNASGAAP